MKNKIALIVSFLLFMFSLSFFLPLANGIEISGDLTTGTVVDSNVGSMVSTSGVEYTVTSPPPCQTFEGIVYAFDGSELTKFCSGFWTSDVSSSIIFTFKSGKVNVNGVKIKTANDSAWFWERNPLSWILSGSNDGIKWTQLKVHSYDPAIVSFLGNYQDYPAVVVSHVGSFSKLRFQVTSKLDNSSSEIQFSELVFTGIYSGSLCDFKGNSANAKNSTGGNKSSSPANTKSQGAGACQNAATRN